MKIALDKIKVKKRIRKKISNIEKLADNIQEIGLIHPLTVMVDNDGGYRLLAGLRRLRAVQMLGWTEVEVTVVSPADEEAALRIEIGENETALPFTSSDKINYERPAINLNVPEQPHLETVTAKDLLTQPIEPLGFTVADILPHGLFILAGSSKIGKSWLALDMSCAVANGGSLWQYSAAQGEVLYLALEDNRKRLHERLNKVSSVCNIDTPTDIHFVTKAQKLGDGLSEQLTEFLDKHPQTKLIVIDTLQYIRNTGKFTGTYSGDYHDMDALREIIAERNLTMLLITHNHKSDDADPVNRVIGSSGLTGAVDGIFVLEKLKRIGNAARLTIANRDTEGHQFELQFDRQNCRWQFVAEANDEDDADGDDLLFVMLDCLLDEVPKWSGTATGLSKALNLLDPAFSVSPISLSKTLRANQKLLLSQYGIVVDFDRSKTARSIELSRVIIVAEYENVNRDQPRLVV